MTAVDDIRRHTTKINIAALFALVSALVSEFGTHAHSSYANTNIMNAGHWLLFALVLAEKTARGGPAVPTWILYGFMFGELDSDSAASVGLLVVSAFAFFQHHRKTENCATPEPASPVHVVHGVDDL
jgi:hypothetical protein